MVDRTVTLLFSSIQLYTGCILLEITSFMTLSGQIFIDSIGHLKTVTPIIPHYLCFLVFKLEKTMYLCLLLLLLFKMVHLYFTQAAAVIGCLALIVAKMRPTTQY